MNKTIITFLSIIFIVFSICSQEPFELKKILNPYVDSLVLNSIDHKYVLFVNISNQDDDDLKYYNEVQSVFEKAFFNSSEKNGLTVIVFHSRLKTHEVNASKIHFLTIENNEELIDKLYMLSSWKKNILLNGNATVCGKDIPSEDVRLYLAKLMKRK